MYREASQILQTISEEEPLHQLHPLEVLYHRWVSAEKIHKNWFQFHHKDHFVILL